MAQGEDLDVLAVVAHRQQAQHRERVRHSEIRQSQQHGRSCSRSSRHAATPPPTRTDEVFGQRNVDVVAPNAPYRVTNWFLDLHGIDVVVHGDGLTADALKEVFGP
ncbi:hypothetical protein ABZX95_39695 [Streptomyces sp. NPDC004232]|uniref:hypothetical protein n=1 Tax=Streptomyces sp. NPDC004232 TaxID=3154454 RepID=UPI001D9BF5BC|nr:hypothetical protein [Streptomyces sp. tea 10]